METFRDDNHCFVCGRANPSGLQLTFDFRPAERAAGAVVTFPPHVQGWREIVHGGILSTVLDEVMIKAAAATGIACVTGELSVKFVKPAKTGIPYTLHGRVTEERGRLLTAEGSLCEADGTVVARAHGKLIRIASGG